MDDCDRCNVREQKEVTEREREKIKGALNEERKRERE